MLSFAVLYESTHFSAYQINTHYNEVQVVRFTNTRYHSTQITVYIAKWY